MKTNELILGVIFSASIFGPILFLYFAGNKRKNKLTKALNQLVSELNLSISVSDIWGDKTLGYDKVKKMLVFISIKGNESIQQHIDLHKVVSCKLLDKPTLVGLQFVNMDSTIDTIELYNPNHDAPLESGFHITLGKKWIDILGKEMPFRPKKAA
jgi:hypothetical protein